MRLRILAPSRPAVARRLGVVLAFTLVGCTPAEQVTRYTAPKDPNDRDVAAEEPPAGEEKVRILGAIVPASDQPDDWYIFKFQGLKSTDTYPPKLIEPHAPEFDAFLQSLKFQANAPPTWTVPAGWEAVTVQSMIPRIATFRMKSGDTAVDLAVSRTGGELLANVNRWRVQQAGVNPITGADIETKCRVLTVDGRRVVVVDVSGPGGKGGGMVAPFAK
jgi:hypothetical protein